MLHLNALFDPVGPVLQAPLGRGKLDVLPLLPVGNPHSIQEPPAQGRSWLIEHFESKLSPRVNQVGSFSPIIFTGHTKLLTSEYREQYNRHSCHSALRYKTSTKHSHIDCYIIRGYVKRNRLLLEYGLCGPSRVPPSQGCIAVLDHSRPLYRFAPQRRVFPTQSRFRGRFRLAASLPCVPTAVARVLARRRPRTKACFTMRAT